ncbi:Ig-like domain-containing protein [Kitasatospora sp. NPDC048296]|uniref:Ig-like domain-containing protein n=1 Tax=Kitasatospora sp. NPDC048296 TaxID=3364048 RepID=UPI00370FAFF8
MSRRVPRTAAALAVLAAGLLTGLNAPFSAAQQSPDTWSGERRAVLPSGLSVQFDFAPAPGAAVTAEPGQLADRSGGGHSATVYTDGMRSGDPAQTFGPVPDRPQTDGSWRTVGTLRLGFSRPVRNPRLHLSGLAAVATGKSGTTSTAARLTLTGGSPAAPTMVDRTDWPGWTVDGNALAPRGADGSTDGAAGSAAEGTLELAGTFRTAVFRVEQRSTARAGSTTAPPVLRQAYTVTVDEDLGTAPQAYGNASHVVSDLFLGADAVTPPRRDRGRVGSAATDDEPLVQLDHGAARRANPFAGPYAAPPPPERQPEIAEPVDGAVLADARPQIRGEGAMVGASVEIRDGDQPLCKARVERGGNWSCRPGSALPAGPHSLTPVETTSGGVVLRGEAVKVTVKTTPPAAPVLTLPAYTNDPGLQLTGTGEAGSTVSVTDRSTSTELCSSAVRSDGAWSCLPVENLADGSHQLAPVAVDAAGNRTVGQTVTLVVDTVPPAKPVLISPAAGEVLKVGRPKLSGRAEPGSNVLVTARAGAAGSGNRTVLCGAVVALDGSWTCTANRDLTDGEQWLTATATDLAGNGTSADPVRVRVAAAAPSPAVSASAVAGPGASAPAVPGAATPVSAKPVVPSPSAAVPVLAPVLPGLLPVTVPPVVPPVVGAPAVSAVPVSSAPSRPTTPAAPTPTAPRTPALHATSPAVTAATAADGPRPAADQGEPEAGGSSARPLPVPPAEAASTEVAQGPAGQSREAGRHGALAGALLALAGLGLITRRVFARGPGARRR